MDSNKHRYLPLEGMYPEDALAYYQALMKLSPEPQIPPPEREALLDLFGKVAFHPLSIGLLAYHLKFRPIKELGERLERLLQDTPETKDNPEKSLLASLNLSLERLSPKARQWLPRLGVFQGGAWEPALLQITELAEPEWAGLRQELATTGLIQIDQLPGVNLPFFKFHPTLAPLLWSGLSAAEQAALSVTHRQCYYGVSCHLVSEDDHYPHAVRAIAQRELPNLLYAVRSVLQAGETWAVEFVDKVNRFLNVFGFQEDRAALARRAEQATGAVGYRAWYLARINRGEQLFSAGRHWEAQEVFEAVLQGLGTEPSDERCVTLQLLGRVLRYRGLLEAAEMRVRQALTEAQQLENSKSVQQMAALQTDLADVLMDKGNYAGAQAGYEAALAIAEEVSELRGAAVVNGQLGTLALRRNNLPEALRRYQKALTTFQWLGEPATEAIYWHQLGGVYQEAHQWDMAERAYREAGRIKDSMSDRASAAVTWNNLAMVVAYAGRPAEAESWYHKALAGLKQAGDQVGAAKVLLNLADLLRNIPGRLAEAWQLAKDALSIQETVDPAVAEIWKIYSILADIATKKGDIGQARGYRRLEREAYAGFAGAWYGLREFVPLIQAVVAATADPAQRSALEATLEKGGEVGGRKLVAAIRRILDGERDEEAICEELGREAIMVHAIRLGIAEPGSLEALLADPSQNPVSDPEWPLGAAHKPPR